MVLTFASEAAVPATSDANEKEPAISGHLFADSPPLRGSEAGQQPGVGPSVTSFFPPFTAATFPACNPHLLEPAEATPEVRSEPIPPASIEKGPDYLGQRWPLKDLQEAMLMRYYIANLARWFDGCDEVKHFTCRVPQLAASSPMLLNAILAFSAKHLSLMGRLDESVTLRYQDACYQVLLSDLQQKAFEAEQLLAVIFLRLSIQMTEYGNGESNYNTFLGLEVFVDAWRLHPRSSLHAAIFMNVLRLYMHVAWLGNRSLPAVEQNCTWMCDLVHRPDDAGVWNCKILMLCARSINYCYDDLPQTPERWMILNALADDWATRKPACFQPILRQAPADGEPFPKIFFAGEVHGTLAGLPWLTAYWHGC
ncbi:hypothetical protein LTR36_009639 [Oleoguttula mirabilis]|uniref:Uncharacterized protein n=1 Tax=Oleoguttula mirabilis TaxID=1507867 RepID=A0AAV9J5T2_9PEZI|nr:hypothetical protein LTR36_009639 [Oleoguttula mirabilis]